MGDCMVAHFYTDVSPTHFVGHSGSCARTEKNVKYKIARIS